MTDKPPTRRLKIAYVADVVDDHGVGAVQSSLRFIEGLKSHHDVTIFATGKDAPGRVEVPALHIPGLQWLVDGNGFNIARPSRDVLRKALPGHDVVYIHYSLLLGWGALQVATELGIPVVFGYHFQPQNILYNLRIDNAWLDKLLLSLFVRKFYSRAQHVICPSPHALRELESCGFNGASSIITNGLPARYHPEDCSRPAQFEDKFVILMVGRLSHEKRHDVVIKAINRSKYKDRIKLVATGKGPTEALVKKWSQSLPVSADVGYVSEEALITLYNTADLMVHASEAELEGMAVLEAIGCGLPALIAESDASASSQFAINERFLFEHGNVAELATKIDYMIDHPDELANAKTAYLEKASHFSFDIALEQMENVICEAAGVARLAAANEPEAKAEKGKQQGA